MFSSQSNLKAVIGDIHLDRMMRYSMFVPRFYKLCKSPGFATGKIMHPRAFCSDESQGYPITLITRHSVPTTGCRPGRMNAPIPAARLAAC